MSVQPEPSRACEPEAALERATEKLDAALVEIMALIGPNAMQARVAGRVLRAQMTTWGQ